MDSPAVWSNFGLMSRVHFPIKKLGISPNIGGEMTFAPYGTSKAISGALVVGISWFVGFGSLDIGFKMGNEIISMGGVTVSPKMRNNK